jgi:integrase
MALILRKGIWQWRKMIDGVMLNRSTGTDDKKLAEQLARKWEHEAVQSIKYQGERPVTVHDAIKAFLDERQHMKGYDSALTHMNRWKAALPDVLMKSLRKQQVQSVIQKRIAQGVAHNSIAVFVIYWNALINYCERNKLSAGPKADRVQAKPTRFRVITLEEEAAILAATCPHAKYPGKTPLNDSRRQDNQDVMVCLMHLGARINEAQNLRWTDINFAENTILVRRLKRGDECLLIMTNALRAVMERRYKSRIDNWVFPTKCQHTTGNAQWVNAVVKRSGINLEGGKITSHTFRHSCATRLLRAGMDIRKVQVFLGHKNLSSTMVYLHAIPSEVSAQAAAVFNGD